MSHTKFYVIDINDEKWEISELNEDESIFYTSMYTAVTNRDIKLFMSLKDSFDGWEKFLNKGVLMKVVGQHQSGSGQNVAMNLCHLAAISQAREILRILIKAGGDLSKRCVGINDTSNRKKFVFKETLVDLIVTHFREPVLFIRHLMDDSIKCHDMGSSYEYVLDFSILHPQMHRQFKDIINGNGSRNVANGNSSSHQMTVLNAILNSTDDIYSEQYELLKHPLIEAFLTCKWKYYRSFFFLLVLIHFTFVLSLSAAAILVLRCLQKFANESFSEFLSHHLKDTSANSTANGTTTNGGIYNTTSAEMLELLEMYYMSMKSVHVLNIFALIAGLLLFMHAIIQAHFIPLKKLVYEFEIISNLLTAPCAMLKCIVVLISPYGWYFDSHHKWIYHLSSFIILPAWINLMLIIGRFPRLGCYSLMFTTVMRNFLKVMISFVFLIIGFALSFSLMFPNSEHFNDSPLALVRTVVMMVGEFDYLSTFTNEKDPFLNGTSRLIFVLFIISCSIILMNLTQGIAVNDIKQLHEISQVIRLEKESRFLYELESVFTHPIIVNQPFLRKVKHKLFDRGVSTDTIRVTRDDRQGLNNTVYEKLVKDFKPEYNINRRPSCIPFYSGQ
ncbi:unnamed protein product [Hermetia illucens]|uniref:Ion transport domain-containing protein n=1 Tax=Hermetia illucens TaxID=343691 RepID=A0A7R8V538_HERIL|nr:transient receptor potential cation channel subfamily A member 1-like [Hermetia illucens]XP_037923656.1 transient receptor potential cation channel subfamily A member 1-like [Hermetia illucens]XP_037923657.1 transient receptor potential cation channel subfamily A member 1-like [Hermetia illucens]CAD7092217.1 unnamed protein product [Hermetia illucens]